MVNTSNLLNYIVLTSARIVYFIVLVLILHPIYPQSISVKGNIATAVGPVRYASILFTDQHQVSKKYTSLTDTLGNYQLDITTEVSSQPTNVPQSVELSQNYPNPFSSSTAISYRLNTPSDAVITVFDILGKEVKTFTLNSQTVGIHGVTWDGKNNYGERIATGIYFYRLRVGNDFQVKKMVYSGGNILFNSPLFASSFVSNDAELHTADQTSPTGTFTIQISNTDSTYPRIASVETTGVAINSNATMNFNAMRIPAAIIEGVQPVKVGQYIILDGSKSMQGEGDTLIYKWTQDPSNPERILFISFDPEIILGFSKEGTYKFTLEINDGVSSSEPVNTVVTVEPRGESNFDDPVLELQVRYTLKDKTGILSDEKLNTIDSLVSEIGFGKITSLKGIEHCTNVMHITYGLNKITDISPLSGLTKLEMLALDQNYTISDITPLAGLTNLVKLNLQDNNIADISSLKNLNKLTSLNLLGNPIKNLLALENMTEMYDLWIGQYGPNIFPLSDALVISKFTKLWLLWITASDLPNISFVNSLTSLQLMRFSFCNVNNVEPISNCKQLVRLYLNSNNISDITPLENLTNLNILDLMYNKITNIASLINNNGLGQGDTIVLIGNPLDSISINQYIPALRSRGATVYY